MHLCSRAGPIATLIVEPAVFKEMNGSELQLHTWATEDFTPPDGCEIELHTLSHRVDLIVCLGGDGTLLWASGLFKVIATNRHRVRLSATDRHRLPLIASRRRRCRPSSPSRWAPSAS